VKPKREQYPVKKGEYVAVVVQHRSAVSMYGRTVLKVSPTDHTTYHLGQVTKATRQGRAEQVKIVGEPGAPIAAQDKLTQTLSIGTRQAEAASLAATFDTPGNNTFASSDHLRAAIIAHASSEDQARYAAHVAEKQRQREQH
jgi:hypothetical protein